MTVGFTLRFQFMPKKPLLLEPSRGILDPMDESTDLSERASHTSRVKRI